MRKVAMCRSCDEPLVCTLAFSHKEFICVKCGRLYEWLEPAAADETPDLLARLDAVQSEWQPIGAALLGGGTMLQSCETCMTTREPHLRHATPDEVAAHEGAIAKLAEIRGVAA